MQGHDYRPGPGFPAPLLALILAVCSFMPATANTSDTIAMLRDDGQGGNWGGYGRTYGQQHYSPLQRISRANVGELGLEWAMDMPPANTVTEPIAVDGTLYFATGLSIVHAVDAKTGKTLWTHDPEVGAAGGPNLRVGWGVRGVAWWAEKVYVGTQDGRLIALDAKSGDPVWTAQTFSADDPAYISGAPRAFGGRILIGFGSTTGAMRGYVSAYDAESGKLAWRFWTVPGNPADGFENEAMAMAAKTWSGEWWRFGGGGAVWNSMAYDPELDMVYIGTGSPYPWNHRIRSQGKGDNLFIASIVALDGTDGAYRWHYQVNPADTWDYDATMDIQLAEIEVAGQSRKVLMQAPKNGFFYVIDRETGEFLSAQAIAEVTWASHIDPQTGRPVENPEARFSGDESPRVAPSSLGAHNWMPMAYSARSGLVYIPVNDFAAKYKELPGEWQPVQDRSFSGGQIIGGGPLLGMPPARGSLLAWSPATQTPAWQVAYPTSLNGGVLATAGDLVFQGTIDGLFRAYDAATGEVLWTYDAGAPILAPPISYEANGRQYVSVFTGTGMGIAVYAGSMVGPSVEKYDINPRTQGRRLLTFAIGGKSALPARRVPPAPPADPQFKADGQTVNQGMIAYATHCATCHGDLGIAIGNGPDLRRSAMILDEDFFRSIVRDGVFQARGMPGFGEFATPKVESIRHYLRARAAELREAPGQTTLPVPGSMGM